MRQQDINRYTVCDTYQREQSSFELGHPTFEVDSPLGQIAGLGGHQIRCTGASNQTRTLHGHSCNFLRGPFPAGFHEAGVPLADRPFPAFWVPSYHCGSNLVSMKITSPLTNDSKICTKSYHSARMLEYCRAVSATGEIKAYCTWCVRPM